MVVQHTLGPAVVPLVVHRLVVPLILRQPPRKIGRAALHQLLVRRAADALAARRVARDRIDEVDDRRRREAFFLQEREGAARRVGQRRVGEQHLGLAVLQNVRDRSRVEPRVERIYDAARRVDAVVRLHKRRRVRREDGDRVAARDAELHERRRQPRRALRRLRIGLHVRRRVRRAESRLPVVVDDAGVGGPHRRGALEECERRQRRVVRRASREKRGVACYGQCCHVRRLRVPPDESAEAHCADPRRSFRISLPRRAAQSDSRAQSACLRARPKIMQRPFYYPFRDSTSKISFKSVVEDVRMAPLTSCRAPAPARARCACRR